MREFDISKPWTILASSPASSSGRPIETKAAEELSRWLGELRGRSAPGEKSEPLPVVASDGPAPDESVPIIVLNAGDSSDGFSWRVGESRVEIYGDSPKGLLNGVYDFLGALGFSWSDPAGSRFPETAAISAAVLAAPAAAASPAGNRGTVYKLARSGFYEKPDSAARLVFPADNPNETRIALIERAARNKADAAHFGSPGTRSLKPFSEEEYAAARAAGIELELDGPTPRELVPALFFPWKPDLFRMESGRRRWDRNFCPTNPRTVRLAAKRAVRFFRKRPPADAYTFRTDTGKDGRSAWCSCPTCRAFSPTEQALMAANAVADALAETAPGARLLLNLDAPGNESIAVEPRSNIIVVKELPDGARQ